MTRVPALRVEVGKELRALLPGWSACLLVLIAAAALRDRTILDAAVLACALGAVILGAQSIGHEYTNRTLTVLLAQPLDRRRLFLIKLGVLAVALVALTIAAWSVPWPVNGAIWRRSLWHQPEIVGVAALCGLFLAPSWTMVSRNPNAGAVFSIFTVVVMVIVADMVAAGLYGQEAAAQIDRFRRAALWWGMIPACAMGAIASWRLFARLEAIEGHGIDVGLPRWLARTGVTTRSSRRRMPLWLLIRKELRLQQMTLVVAALYPLFVAAVLLLGRSSGDGRRLLLPLSLPYSAVLALLTGALASAEERRFGTLEAQVLLPISMREQWGVKVGVTLGMTLVVATALTFLVHWNSSFPISLRGAQFSFWRDAAIMLTVLASCSLYLSSLSNSGVGALVLSIPAVFAGLLVVELAESVVWWTVYHVVLPVRPPATPPAHYFTRLTAVRSAIHFAWLIDRVALVTTLLYFAFVNHRSSERSVARTLRQVSILAMLLIAGVLGGGILAAYLR